MRHFICTAALIFAFVLLLLPREKLYAQTEVTFNVNMTPHLQDSIFVPGRGDVLEITGNQQPLGANRTKQLMDTEPIDSVYSVTITFPRYLNGRNLQYRFVLKTPNRTVKEDFVHYLELNGEKIETDPLYFNTFAK